MMTAQSHDLTAAEILAMCRFAIPVNTDIEQAIKAHGMSLATEDRQLQQFTLRAVILAALPTLNDMRRQVDYLTALPLEVWNPWAGVSRESIRENTLAGIARNITVMRMN